MRSIRAQTLYDARARKDGAVVETALVDDDRKSTNFEFQLMALTRKKQVKCVVVWTIHSDAAVIT